MELKNVPRSKLPLLIFVHSTAKKVLNHCTCQLKYSLASYPGSSPHKREGEEPGYKASIQNIAPSNQLWTVHSEWAIAYGWGSGYTERCSCCTIVGQVWTRSTLVQIEVRVITHSHEASTKVRVFCEHAACFYDLADCPTSGCSEVSHGCQDTAI